MNTVNKNKINIELLLINILIPQLLGVISTLLSGDISGKYDALVKPIFAPPSWVFSLVWTIIYFLMGVSAYFIAVSWNPKKKEAVFYYTAQLAINFLWNMFFFGLNLKLFSFLWILLLIVFVHFTIKSFYNISKISGYLLLPYLVWLIFAAYLNFMFWVLNK